MKAAAWHRRVSLLAGAVACSLLIHPARANAPLPGQPSPAAARGEIDHDLPAGLPGLPSIGETMRRDLRQGLALNGFDPVSYRMGRPAAGSRDHELVLDGIVWRFASQANLEAFRDAPEIYAPAFGGFDPTGVAAGVAVDTEPTQYAVVGVQLFLFRTLQNRERFLANPRMLGEAKARWIEVSRQVVR